MTTPISAPVLLADEEPPVLTPADVRRAYPSALADRTEDEAPVLAAAIDGQTAMFVAFQDGAAQAAAQSDPARATGMHLDGHAEDRGIKRSAGEEDETLRARMFFPDGVVTPEAIKATADAVLEPYTETPCILWETILDRWFVFDGGGDASSHVGDGDDDAGGGFYPDRYYNDRETSHPGGAMPFDDHDGRYYVLRVPDLGGLGEKASFVFNGTQDAIDDGPGWFVFDSSADVGAFVFENTRTAREIYEAIVAAVAPLVGHGVRWMMTIDPKLTP